MGLEAAFLYHLKIHANHVGCLSHYGSVAVLVPVGLPLLAALQGGHGLSLPLPQWLWLTGTPTHQEQRANQQKFPVMKSELFQVK